MLRVCRFKAVLIYCVMINIVKDHVRLLVNYVTVALLREMSYTVYVGPIQFEIQGKADSLKYMLSMNYFIITITEYHGDIPFPWK